MNALQLDYQSLAFGPGVVGLYLVALVLDALLGRLPALQRLVPHPAMMMAAVVDGLAQRLNRANRGPVARLMRGLLAEIVVIALALAVGFGLDRLTDSLPFFWIFTLLALISLTILRGPFDEVSQVMCGYLKGGLPGARQQAATVIGPQASKMNENQINNAVVLHLAARFADGLVAGVFWLIIFGLPGFLLWRWLNIAGRLLDDKRADMAQFGLIATRLNEAVGLLPAWIAGLILAIAALFVPGAHPLRALGALLRSQDAAHRHSERVAIAVTMAALVSQASEAKTKSFSAPDVVRAQFLYAVGGLLVFAFMVVWATARYAI